MVGSCLRHLQRCGFKSLASWPCPVHGHSQDWKLLCEIF